MTEALEKGILDILRKTFATIDTIYLSQCESRGFNPETEPQSRLIFPRRGRGEYNNGEYKEGKPNSPITRVSEQELRFAFIEQFIKKCGVDFPFFYAVETPTDKRYVFSTGDNTPRLAVLGQNGIKGKQEGTSGNFDVTIHDKKGNRVCWIEFKAGMPKPKDFSKDILKLNEEATKDCDCAFFIHLLLAADKGTYKQIVKNRLKKPGRVRYFCHVLPDIEKCEKSGQTFSSLEEIKEKL